MGTVVIAAQASERARTARLRAQELGRLLVRLRAEEAPTERDVELAEAALDASRHYRALALRSAAELQAAQAALARTAADRATLRDLAPDRGPTKGFPLQREPLPVEQAPRDASTYELSPDRETPSRARRLIRSRCRHLPGDKLDMAVLLTSELVTNAVVHSEGTVLLGVQLGDHSVRIAVTDGVQGEVRVADGSDWPEGGHGLRMVEAMSAAWGVEQIEGAGKRVWFELSL